MAAGAAEEANGQQHTRQNPGHEPHRHRRHPRRSRCTSRMSTARITHCKSYRTLAPGCGVGGRPVAAVRRSSPRHTEADRFSCDRFQRQCVRAASLRLVVRPSAPTTTRANPVRAAQAAKTARYPRAREPRPMMGPDTMASSPAATPVRHEPRTAGPASRRWCRCWPGLSPSGRRPFPACVALRPPRHYAAVTALQRPSASGSTPAAANQSRGRSPVRPSICSRKISRWPA
jgi:hypothetical protein